MGGSMHTRNRLLLAAGEVFAERGYRKATVREIVGKIGANVNAVNYHFGDKLGLYVEVFRYAHEHALRLRQHMDPRVGLTPEGHLHVFVSAFLERMLGEGEPAWFGKLLANEMLEPTEALDRVVEEMIGPQQLILMGIVRDLGQGRLSDERIRLCVMSIIAQCTYYRHARPMITRLNPSIDIEASSAPRIADHITSFSVAAIRGLANPETASSDA